MNHLLSQPTLPQPTMSPERTPVLRRLGTIVAAGSIALLYATGAAAQTASAAAQTASAAGQIAAQPITPSITLKVAAATGAVTSVPAGTAITLTATVPVNGVNLQTGIVRFCDLSLAPHCTHENKLAYTSLTRAGNATYKFTPGPGTHNYAAVFYPQWRFNSVTSAAASLMVTTANATTTTLTQAGTTGNYTLTAHVLANGPAGLLPTGTVQFLDTSANNHVLGASPLISAPVALSFTASTLATGTVSGYSSVATGDFNKDGNLDMAVVGADSTSIQILYGNGDGTFTQGPTVGNFYQGIRQLKAADLNQDGNLDLAAVDLNNSVIHIFLGHGDGTFTQTTDAVSQFGTDGITITDYNKDGIPDMIVANAYSGTVSFLAGKGDGTFTSGWASYVSEKNPTSVISGDFNHDGNQDFAVNVLNGSQIAIYLGNGDGTFQQPVYYSVGPNPAYLTAGDFNGDGGFDLAVANSGDNTITLLLGNGDGTFTTKGTFPAPAGLTDILSADFNQDGKVDLVASTATGLAYFLGAGDGTFTPSAIVPASAPYQIALGDFNNDGLLDVASANDGNSATASLTNLSQGSTAILTGLSVPGNGKHLAAARYLGDLNFGNSTSATTALTALTVNTSARITPSSFMSGYGKQLVLSAAVSPYVSGNNATNGETVYFWADGKLLGQATLQSGSASFNTTSLPIGYHLIGITYAGDNTFAASLGLNLVSITR